MLVKRKYKHIKTNKNLKILIQLKNFCFCVHLYIHTGAKVKFC